MSSCVAILIDRKNDVTGDIDIAALAACRIERRTNVRHAILDEGGAAKYTEQDSVGPRNRHFQRLRTHGAEVERHPIPDRREPESGAGFGKAKQIAVVDDLLTGDHALDDFAGFRQSAYRSRVLQPVSRDCRPRRAEPEHQSRPGKLLEISDRHGHLSGMAGEGIGDAERYLDGLRRLRDRRRLDEEVTAMVGLSQPYASKASLFGSSRHREIVAGRRNAVEPDFELLEERVSHR